MIMDFGFFLLGILPKMVLFSDSNLFWSISVGVLTSPVAGADLCTALVANCFLV